MNRIGLITLLCLLLAVPAVVRAHDEGSGSNLGAIGLKSGIDLTTQYNFRGINVEDQGSIIQPWLEINAVLYSGDALAPMVEGVKMKFGFWNTIQEDSPKTQAHGSYFEADYSLGLILDLCHELTGEVSFVYLEDPDVVGNYSEEVDLKLALDDSAQWEGVLDLPGFKGLQPHVLVVIETNGSTDAAGNGGDIYYEFGINPSVLAWDNPDYPVTLSVPMKLALGDNYYEYINAGGNLRDDSFGYFSVGLVLSAPLSFVPADHGQWQIHAGVDFLFLGNGAEALTSNGSLDSSEIVGSAGISMEY